MIGGGETPAPAERATGVEGRVRLELGGLGVDDDRGHRAVNDVSLAVRGGEIVGVAGVSGNGQAELVEVLAGSSESTSLESPQRVGDLFPRVAPGRAGFVDILDSLT